ncbi:hypothetical protein EDB84DRAFT_1439762 [Lactarius hengduanensis]|nr:hypothetical protein EDB84DRAFT_1439762 [Lactarius hengduanensis]
MPYGMAPHLGYCGYGPNFLRARERDSDFPRRSVASAALIRSQLMALQFYDWALTGADELGFLWRRERITYTRVLFALARYPALACAVVDLLPPTVKLDKVTTCLRLVAVLCSELILATRTWAIWERSRRMLVFLAVLAIACAATAIVIIERDIVTTVVAPSAAPTIQGVRQCQVLTSAVKHAWIVPYLVVMVFEAVVLALTVYKILGYYRGIPKQLRSKLFDVLWVDGVMYFVFMLREPIYPMCPTSVMFIAALIVLGILNVGLVLQVQVPQLRAGGTQLQTVLHSVLSTRIVLHLVAVSKQDLVDSRSTLARYRVPTRMHNALKSRPTVEETEPSSPDVMSSVLEQHPNLSLFHNDDDAENSTQPTRLTIKDSTWRPQTDIKEREERQWRIIVIEGSFCAKAAVASTKEGEIPHEHPYKLFNESDTNRLKTPMDGMYGSLRSILRDRNTPATGQSVRFFSRDAFRVMTPDGSATSEQGESPLPDNLRVNEANPQAALSPSGSRVRHRARAQDLFLPAQSTSSPSSSSSIVAQSLGSMTPLPPPEFTSIFDMSQRDLPPITADTAAPLLDDAVEIFETDQSMEDDTEQVSQQPMSSPTITRLLKPKEGDQTLYHSMETSKATMHDRSHSFSFGQTVFRPMPKLFDSADAVEPSPGRNRAVSESMFYTLSRVGKNPESEINDLSPAAVVLYSTPSADRASNLSPPPTEPDPFRANATTFYTPGTLLPPSPPTAPLGHARKPSQEEGMIWSLRTQLALQQELCAQYEVDLGARDALVSALTQRVDTVEKENEKRRGAVRGWKKKVQELERLCRNLEEEVDRSREESVERSIMDEASGEALRQLHRQIAGLEREKGELVRNSIIVLDPPARIKQLEDEVGQLREEIRQRDEVEHDLQEDLRTAQEQIELLNTVGAMDDESRIASVAAVSEEHERRRQAEEEWEEERKALRREAEDATRALAKKEDEMVVLRDELEAQWKNTEQTGEGVARLREERNVLQSELVALEARIESMELDWNDADNRRLEAENALHVVFAEKENLEHEKVQVTFNFPLCLARNVFDKSYFQLEAELAESRQHADDLQENTESLRQELKAANDSVARLDQDIRQRDTELEGLAHRVVAHEDEAEDARSELATLKREQTCTADEHRRALADVTARAEGAQAELEAAVRGKGEADIAADVLRERVGTLEAELEKLRKQVRELQAESANREVHTAQMEKQRERDRDDLQGLNIALDSKQQELELLKRRMSVKVTSGPTPAPGKVGHIRRESSTFSSPAHTSRPASRLSDDSKDTSKAGKAAEVSSITARVTTLGKSVRINATTPTTTTSNKVPTPTTVKPTRTVEGSMGPPPTATRHRASLSTTTSPTAASHARVPSTSSTTFGRAAAKSPPPATTTAGRAALRRPTSMSGTELLRQAKLTSSSSSSSDVDRSSGSASDEKENTMRPSPRATASSTTGSLSAASKRRSMIAAPMS